MARFGFCGPTYQAQSLNADCERCVNFVPTPVESQNGKAALVLDPSPGTKAAYNLGATSILGQWSCQPAGSSTDRLFAVVQNGVNQVLFELFADGSKLQRGTLNAPTTARITFSDNGTHLIICTGGQLWLFNMSTNAAPFQVGPSGSPTIGRVAYSDGFFIALQAQSNKFYVSALLDGTTWPGLGIGEVSEFPDNVISMIVNQRLPYFFGRKASVPYQNVGALNMPFLPISGVFVENGCGAPDSVVKLDNSVFWLDVDDRGGAIARRNSGVTPQRVSNHSVENIWQSYPTIADAVSYAFQDQGHSIWHIYFPSGTSVDGIPGAGASWRYDVETGYFHEVAFWNATAGHFEAHHSQNHAYAFGKHFVGDWKSGTVYQMATPSASGTKWQFADDAGSPIRRLRRSPVISKENQWIFHSEIQFDIEAGLGPQPALLGSLPPTLYILADASGNLSTVGVNDAGALTVTGGAIAAAQAIILNDPMNLTSWQLGIEAGGPRGIDKLVTPGNYPSSLIMVSNSGTQLYELQISQAGVLQTVALGPVTRDPQLMLRWSNDHGHTWTNYYPLDCGKAGQYAKRVIRRRLGRSRNRVYEVTMTDPIPWRIVDAYLKATDFAPTERLLKQIAKGA